MLGPRAILSPLAACFHWLLSQEAIAAHAAIEGNPIGAVLRYEIRAILAVDPLYDMARSAIDGCHLGSLLGSGSGIQPTTEAGGWCHPHI